MFSPLPFMEHRKILWAFSIGSLLSLVVGSIIFVRKLPEFKRLYEAHVLLNEAIAISDATREGRDLARMRDLYRKSLELHPTPEGFFLYASSLVDDVDASEDPATTEKNAKKARQLFEANWQIDQHVPSLLRLAHMIYAGEGGEKDLSKARQYLETCWERNTPKGLYLLAKMVQRGEGGPQDAVRARDLFEKSWELAQFDESLYELATMYEVGEGGPADLAKAREYYETCWEDSKHSVAGYMIADMLRSGEGGLADAAKARQIFEENWQTNQDVDSLCELATMLQAGEGGEKDPIKAREAFEKCSELEKNAEAG